MDEDGGGGSGDIMWIDEMNSLLVTRTGKEGSKSEYIMVRLWVTL